MTALATAGRVGPAGVRARCDVVVGLGPRGPRLHTVATSPPLGVRLAGGEVWLAATAGGPHGGDDLTTNVRVLAGTTVTVRSVAATLALPGDGTASHARLHVTVEAGAHLRWLPEPLVAAAGCDHHADAVVELAGDASLVWREEVVLGRVGEAPGALRASVRIVRDRLPVLVHGLDTTRPGWDGPAVTAGHRVVGLAAAVGAPGLAGSALAGSALSGSLLAEEALESRPLGDLAPVAASHGSRIGVSRLADDVVLASGTGVHHAGWRADLAAHLPAGLRTR